jgi:hypothetical protein
MTLKAIEQEQAFGLDMVTFCSHTSHAFQSLNIFCFKRFKTKFKEEKDETIVRNNCLEPNKVMLTSLGGLAIGTILTILTKNENKWNGAIKGL